MNKLLLALSAIVLSAAICHSAEITLEEIVALHKEASQVIRSARISYTIEHRESERHIRSTMAGVPEKDIEVLFRVKTLRRNYTEQIDWTFDADIDAFKELKTYKRDLAKLVDGLDVSDDESLRDIQSKLLEQIGQQDYRYSYLQQGNLYKTHNSAVLDGIRYRYRSEEGDLVIFKDGGGRPRDTLIRKSGFVRSDALERYKEVEITGDPADTNLVVLSFKMYGDQFEYVLDRSLGYRIVSSSRSDEDGYGSKTSITYQKVGDCIFPVVIDSGAVYPDGEFRRGPRTVITAAEFNIPIDKSEFKLEPPPGAGVNDHISGTYLPSRERMAEERRKDLDALLLDALEEKQAAASPVEEPAVVQGEAVEEEPQETPAAPARETGRDGGFWIVCAVLLIAVVAVLASVMRKKRH